MAIRCADAFFNQPKIVHIDNPQHVTNRAYSWYLWYSTLSKSYRKHTISWFYRVLWNTHGCTATSGVVFVDIGFLAPDVENLWVFVHKTELWKGFRKMKTSRNSLKSNHCKWNPPGIHSNLTIANETLQEFTQI